ncbi:Thi4 family-domain-containing protein [Gaertneriomyces semiglobifer]|nr:Thi4 family-domain-containing protein [Gaertneriomyces semiglobifer]
MAESLAALPLDVTFAPIRESAVSREMTTRYMNQLLDYADSDVVIIGAGPAGLSAAYELTKYPHIKVALIEASVAPGGGAWVGGQLMTPMVVRKPAHLMLSELGVEFDETENYVVLKHAGLFTATILAKVLAAPNVTLFNATSVEDLLIRSGRVSGVVTNWALVTKAHGTQSCMDPQVLESKIVISSCGHDGPFGATGVRRLAELGMCELKGMRALDMNAAEDEIVKNTGEIVPGMIVTGMEVAEAYGTARMGPTFGGMLMSGRKAALVAVESLKKNVGK